MDGWNTTFLLGLPIFRGENVSFREGTLSFRQTVRPGCFSGYIRLMEMHENRNWLELPGRRMMKTPYRWFMAFPGGNGVDSSERQKSYISSWWLNHPFEKYARQNGFIFPNFRGEHKKYLKPPPRYFRGYHDRHPKSKSVFSKCFTVTQRCEI